MEVSRLLGHGGIFRGEGGAGRRFLAAAAETTVCTMEHAEMGGPWGCALLAEYCRSWASRGSLETFLSTCVFQELAVQSVQPAPEDVKGFAEYFKRFERGLALEKMAHDIFRDSTDAACASHIADASACL